MNEDYYKIKNKIKRNQQPPRQTKGILTIAQYCKIIHIKLQDFKLKDYYNYWNYCHINNYDGIGTGSVDVEKGFTIVRQMIDRCQELFIF